MLPEDVNLSIKGEMKIPLVDISIPDWILSIDKQRKEIQLPWIFYLIYKGFNFSDNDAESQAELLFVLKIC